MSENDTQINTIDCKLCILCQEENGRSAELRSSIEGYKKLAQQLQKFKEAGGVLRSDLDVIENVDEMFSYFHEKKAVYHKNCYNKYRDDKIFKFKNSLLKGNSSSTHVESGLNRSKRSTEWKLGELRCAICRNEDKIEKLHMAAEVKIQKSVDLSLLDHLKLKTAEWKELAKTPGYENLHSLLVMGDLKSNEIFYHNKCWSKLKRDSEKYNNEQNSKLENDIFDFKVNYCFRKAYHELYDALHNNPSQLIELNCIYENFEILCRQYNINLSLNITKFKNRLQPLLSDEIEIVKSGNKLFVGLSAKIKAVAISSMKEGDTFESLIMKLTKTVRKDMKDFSNKETSLLTLEEEKKSVPKSLLQLMGGLLEGDCNKISRGVLTVAQIAFFNFRTKPNNKADMLKKHVNMSPLTTYIALLLYNTYRCKNVINNLYEKGLCISYHSLLDFTASLANAEIVHYQTHGIVCPSKLKLGIVTTIAIDNIDHATSSMTARSELHGTAISVTQHLIDPFVSTDQEELNFDKSKKNYIMDLPENYISVPEVFLNDRVAMSSENTLDLSDEEVQSINMVTINQVELNKEKRWLTEIYNQFNHNEQDINTNYHWAAWHASQRNDLPTKKIVNTVLPIFHESAASPGMIKHGLDIAKSLTEYLNPGQIPVVCYDQQLYALAKHFQWQYPDNYGIDKIFLVMGGLHIEKQIEQVLGRYFEGSGLTDMLVTSKIMSNSDKAFLNASDITKTRYFYQVIAITLYSLIQASFQKTDDTDFDVWLEKLLQENANFKYWYLGLELILKFLIFIRSIRDADFDLYIDSFHYWVRWFFIYDHHNYARYGTVHLVDLLNIQNNNKPVYELLKKGIFTANKNDSRFSNIHLDQNHEQLNAYLKGCGGIIGLTENPTALKRFLVCAPLISQLCCNFEDNLIGESIEVPNLKKHHSELPYLQKRFKEDTEALLNVFLTQKNPFNLEIKTLINVHTHAEAESSCSDLIFGLEKKATTLFENYLKDVFIDCSQAIYIPIKQNNIDMFGVKDSSKNKNKVKLESVKTCNKLLTNLFIVAQQRHADLSNILSHEISFPPLSLYSTGEIKMGKTKSKLMKCLIPSNIDTIDFTACSALLIDGSTIAQSCKPKAVTNILEYVEKTFVSMINRKLKEFQRVDIIFDQYFTNSIKNVTRESRGSLTSSRYHISPETPIPRNWENFMKNSDNKTDLFKFIALTLVQKVFVPIGKEFFCSFEENVISLPSFLSKSNMEPCSHEEVDTRIFLHAKDCTQKGMKNIILKARDTDVVVLSLVHFQEINAERLWIEYGLKNDRVRHLPIHQIQTTISSIQRKGLPFFHSFSGCDSTTAFVGFSKVSCWNVWMESPDDFNELFSRLSSYELFNENEYKISESDFTNLQKFVSILFQRSKNSIDNSINETRKRLFLTKGTSLDTLPPTKDVLYFKVLRAMYQSMVWKEALKKQPVLPLPTDWGWCFKNESLSFMWSTLPDMIKGCWETFIKCNCKKSNCAGKCSCKKARMNCTTLCGCQCISTI